VLIERLNDAYDGYNRPDLLVERLNCTCGGHRIRECRSTDEAKEINDVTVDTRLLPF
jgi:hypothetical protein